jgi:hypothetical protein
MDVGGQALLGARVAGAAVRIFTDRVNEALGTALPRTPEQLASPATLSDLIRDYGAPSGKSLPPIREALLPGIEFESSNCQNFLIDVVFGDGTQTRESLPRTFYAKMPCAEFGTRAFANAVGFWEVEAEFCANVAERVAIRVPRVYAAAWSGARFVLLLENLNELPGTRMFINRDMAAGTNPDRARMCLDTFAELHAPFWGSTAEEREALLPRRLNLYLTPRGRSMSRALNASAIASAHKKAPEIFKAEHAAICRLAIEKWDALVEWWYRDPLTLIHGDSHLANCFEYQSESGPRMGMIDFQGMQWCRGIRDVQYFLINSLEPNLLACHEDELIDHYIAELGKRGIVLEASDAREQYRALSFQTLMVSVVSLGLGSLTEREDTMRTILRRSVAAIERLNFGGWLSDL